MFAISFASFSIYSTSSPVSTKGNGEERSPFANVFTEDFQKLYESMRGLKYQMTDTLLSIGETSNQVSSGSNHSISEIIFPIFVEASLIRSIAAIIVFISSKLLSASFA